MGSTILVAVVEGALCGIDGQHLVIQAKSEAGAAPFSWLLWNGHFGALMGSI